MRGIWVMCFFLLFSLVSKGQSPEYHLIGEEQQLPCNEIYDIYQDKKGYLWLGTEIGLFRYDGKYFKSFRCGKLSGRPVVGTTEVGDHIYANNFNGQVFEIIDDSLHRMLDAEAIIKSGYPQLFNFEEELYASTSQGLYKQDVSGKKWERIFPLEKSVSTKSFNIQIYNHKMYLAADDKIWVTSGEKFKNLKIDWTGIKEKEKELSHYHLNIGANGSFLVNVFTGEVLKYSEGSFRSYNSKKLSQALEKRKLTSVRQEGAFLYILTFSGMVCYNTAKDEAKVFYEGIPCTDLILDRENNYWISTLGYGLMQVPEINFRTYSNINSVGTAEKITRIESNESGVYFTRLSGNIGYIKNGIGEPITIPVPFESDITALSVSGNNKVSLALNSALYEIVGAKLKPIEDALPPIKEFLYTQKGNYIAASTGLYFHPNGIPKNNELIKQEWFRVMTYDSASNIIWAGSVNGIYKVQETQVLDSFLIGQTVSDVLWMPSRSTLFAVSLNSHVYSIKNGEVKLIRAFKKSGLQIYKMESKGEILFLATTKGLCIYNSKSDEVTWFQTQDGIASNIIYDVCVYSNKLWLATSHGVQILPLLPVKKTSIPLLYLQEIVHNDKELVKEKDVYQIVKDEELRFSFDVLSYSSNGQYNLSYSYDQKHWEDLNIGQNEFNLQVIPSGLHSLYVRVKDYNGIYSKASEIRLNVKPLFWETSIFYFLLVFGTMTIATLGFVFLLRNERKKQNNRLEKAQLKTDVIESQLTALKAQMNPHFIFNSLNSIYELIILSEPKEAAAYLNKFATLLRKVLENSEKDTISLLEECEWLQLYLELEKLRFGADFSYQIDMNEVKDAYDIMIPTMLLQPFVENAVKHGLLHKEGIKRIDIEFKEHEDTLICLVRDNGVGREAAESFKIQNNKHHKSFATGAINKRIEMLNVSKKFRIYLEIHDLKFPDESPAGTEVEIQMDLN